MGKMSTHNDNNRRSRFSRVVHSAKNARRTSKDYSRQTSIEIVAI
jgi:hypothetical protein